jgi:hypothetical protein
MTGSGNKPSLDIPVPNARPVDPRAMMAQAALDAAKDAAKAHAEPKPDPSMLSRMIGALPFKVRSKSNTFTRRHMRHECCIVGKIFLTTRDIPIDGVFLELSLGGMLFRPAAIYILDRTGEEITAQFAGILQTGRIVASRDTGYGVKLDKNLDDAMLQSLMERFGYRAGEHAFGTDMAAFRGSGNS